MQILRSLAFNICFFAWSASMHVLALPLLLGPRAWIVAAARTWAAGVMALLRVVVGLDYEVRGRRNLPAGPCLVACKHQSAWDTMILPLLIADTTFVLKRELMWVPLLGWYLWRYGVVAVDRRGGARALRRMVADARVQLERGRSVAIFPEGTRTPPGQRRPYHPGVAALYRELALPVVPVALNSGLFWARRAFRKRPGRIVIEFLPPIPPGLERRAFMRRLQDDLEGASAGLVAEARGGERVRADGGVA